MKLPFIIEILMICKLFFSLFSLCIASPTKFLRYKGGPPLPRKMISQGVSNKKQFNVEVYPLLLKLVDSRDNSEIKLRISKKV